MGKKTPLFEEHKALGASMVDFGGWEMPVYYTNVIEEHNSTRNACGLFDICHMGEIIVEGKDALSLVQHVFSRDISGQKTGQMNLGVLCNEEGGIIDDLTVYKLEEQKFMLVVNSSTAKKDFEWVKRHAEGFEAQVTDISSRTAKLDIQGPRAQEILQKIVSFDLSEMNFYNFREEKKSLAGLDCIVSRSGYTGEDGFEVYFDWGKAVEIWGKLLAQGKSSGIVPVGLGARDTLRLEAAFNLYGNEMDEETNPFECRYGWVVSLEKEFIGKNAIVEQKENGLKRKLVGFEMLDRSIGRHGYGVFVEGEKVGVVTSGSPSPTLKKNIGLCSIKPEAGETEKEIEIEIREKKYKAVVVPLPFYKRRK